MFTKDPQVQNNVHNVQQHVISKKKPLLQAFYFHIKYIIVHIHTKVTSQN